MKVLSDTTPGDAPKLRPRIACGPDNGQHFSDLMGKIVQQMGELQAAAKAAVSDNGQTRVSTESGSEGENAPSSEPRTPQSEVGAEAISQAASAQEAPVQVRSVEQSTPQLPQAERAEANEIPAEQLAMNSDSSKVNENAETPPIAPTQEQKISDSIDDVPVQVVEQLAVESASGPEVAEVAEQLELSKVAEQKLPNDGAETVNSGVEAALVAKESLPLEQPTDTKATSTDAAQLPEVSPASTELAEGLDVGVKDLQNLAKNVAVSEAPSELANSTVQKADQDPVVQINEQELRSISDLELAKISALESEVQPQPSSPRLVGSKFEPGSAFVARYIQQVLPPLESATEVLKGALLRDLLAAPKLSTNTPSVVAVGTTTGTNNGVSSFGVNQPSTQARAAGEREKSPRPMARAAEARTLETVEKALKEVARSRDGKTISVRLDPPSLGSLKLDVTLKDGTLHARITVEHAQVATLLRDRAFDLHALLRRSGFNAERVTLTVSEGQRFEDLGGSDLAGSNAESNSSPESGLGEESGGDFEPGKERDLGRGRSARNENLDHWIA